MIGDIFKENRKKSGVDLKEAAQTLRIRHEYLKALEEDAFERLPADVYTKGYIREYAKFLGIDPEPILREYEEKKNPAKQPASKKEAPPDIPPAKKGFNYLPALLIISVIFFFIANVYVYYRRSLVLKHGGEYSRSSSMPEAGKNNPSSAVISGKEYILELTAGERTWLRIESDNAEPEEVMMEPGESIEWEAKDGFDIKIGNAGGVRAVLNGKDMGNLGKSGQVIKIRLP